jgi:hypothetical protein
MAVPIEPAAVVIIGNAIGLRVYTQLSGIVCARNLFEIMIVTENDQNGRNYHQ